MASFGDEARAVALRVGAQLCPRVLRFAAPTTVTSWISLAGTPRKLIWVCGLAVPVSGAGETATPTPGRRALWLSVAGRQAGAAPAVEVLENAPGGKQNARQRQPADERIAVMARPVCPC